MESAGNAGRCRSGRGRHPGRRRRDALHLFRDAVRDHRRPGLAEVREPPVHGVVQGAGRAATSSCDSRRRAGGGVVAASAGNHAQGLAYHAHRLGIPATIVMPADTPFTKVTRTEHHGATSCSRRRLRGRAAAEALSHAETGARRSCRRSTTPRSSPGREPSRSRSSPPCPRSTRSSCRSGAADSSPASRSRPRLCSPTIEVVGAQLEGYTSMLHALGRGPAPDPAARRSPKASRSSKPANSPGQIVARARRRPPRRLRTAHRRSGRARDRDREDGRRRRRRGRTRRAVEHPDRFRDRSSPSSSPAETSTFGCFHRCYCARWPVRAASCGW